MFEFVTGKKRVESLIKKVIRFKGGLFHVIDCSHGVDTMEGDIVCDNSLILSDRSDKYITLITKIDKEKDMVCAMTFFSNVTPLSLMEVNIKIVKEINDTEKNVSYTVCSNRHIHVAEITRLSNLYNDLDSFTIYKQKEVA